MKISYSLMSSDYLPSLLNTINTCFSPGSTLEKLEEDFYNPISNYIIAIDDTNDEVIGFIAFWTIASESDIINVGVLPNFRKLGIGTKLIDSLITVCKDLDIIKVHLEVRESNNPAINLYTKFNFKNINIRKNYYSNPKENALVMTLNIR